MWKFDESIIDAYIKDIMSDVVQLYVVYQVKEKVQKNQFVTEEI